MKPVMKILAKAQGRVSDSVRKPTALQALFAQGPVVRGLSTDCDLEQQSSVVSGGPCDLLTNSHCV